MICRNCKHRIPDHFLQAESFKCLHCGKVYRRKASQTNVSEQKPIESNPTPNQKPFLVSLLCKRIWKFPLWAYLLGTVLCIIIAACDPSSTNEKTAQPTATVLPTVVTVTQTPEAILKDTSNVDHTIETAVSSTPSMEPAATFPNISSDDTQEFAATPAEQSIKMGDSGEKVVNLQKRLIALGYLNERADGQFGQKTKSAVEEYQRVAGLPVTGICDYDTYTSMTSSFAPQKITSSSNDKPRDERVWIAPYSGNKYHDKNCRHLDDARSVKEVSLNQAKKQGFEPCGTCR